ncbi:MAG: hypothetical protein Q9175_002635 [Cornicularia normoerica]
MDDDRAKRWSKEFTPREERDLREAEAVGTMAERAEYALLGNQRLLEKRQKERAAKTTSGSSAANMESRKEKPKDAQLGVSARKGGSFPPSGTDKGQAKDAPENSKSAERK